MLKDLIERLFRKTDQSPAEAAVASAAREASARVEEQRRVLKDHEETEETVALVRSAAETAPETEAPAVSDDVEVEPLLVAWRDPVARRQFGGAFGPMVAAAMSGRVLKRASFESDSTRIVCGDTLPRRLKGGAIDAWGVAAPGLRGAASDVSQAFVAPEDAVLRLHAVRGPESAAAFDAAGLDAPEAFGDPAWFAPRLFDLSGVEKGPEVGFLRGPRPEGEAEHPHDEVPEALEGAVRVIDLECAPTLEAWTEKAREIASCKRILCDLPSMAAYVEAQRIPTALLARGGGGGQRVRFDDAENEISADLRDVYLGLGAEDLLLYRSRGKAPIDWEAVIDAIDAHWSPLAYDPAAFFEAAPFETRVDPTALSWAAPASLDAAQGRAAED